jgi:hypothetical protein
LTRQGLPTVRTINVRDVMEEERDGQSRGLLRFSTDARSGKVGEFIAMARSAAAEGREGGAVAELCWFFPVTREQYRLRCNVQLIFSAGAPVATAAAAASSGLPAGLVRDSAADLASHASFWRSHSADSRGLFGLAQPGSHRKRVASPGDLDHFEAQEVESPSANFVSVLLLPTRCDYLKLPRPAEDTRGQISRVKHHESMLQPSRSQQRWLHSLDRSTGAWTTVELNP